MAGLLPGALSGKLRRLAFCLDRYGDELVHDFHHEYQLHWGDLWNRGQWLRLQVLIDRLPSASLYYAAIANDPEHVALILQATEGQPSAPKGPSVADWTTEVEMLASIKDTLSELVMVSVSAAGGKPKPPKATERPTTAFQEVRSARMKAKHEATVNRVMRARRRSEPVE